MPTYTVGEQSDLLPDGLLRLYSRGRHRKGEQAGQRYDRAPTCDQNI